METAKEPSLALRVGAAIYVMSMWPVLPGVGTINTLMWPYQAPPMLPLEGQNAESAQGPWVLEPEDVRRAAAKLLASVQAALLEAVPPERSARIQTEQAEYLSSTLEPALQDERVPSLREAVLHPPQNVAVWLQALSGPCRPGQTGT